jgi:hypothetical protein
MASVLVSMSRLIASARALLAGLARRPQGATMPQPAPSGPILRVKPLRVVRVLEPSAPRSTAGRMVISGRLADVCAELDRMAALEAQRC